MKALTSLLWQQIQHHPSLLSRLLSLAHYQEYAKGSYLLTMGHVCSRIWFLQQGISHSFLIRSEERFTTWLYNAETIVYGGDSFMERTPSEESIQALADCITWYITREELEELFIPFPEAEHMHHKIYNQYVQQIKRHSNMKGLVSLEQRMHWLQIHFEDLLYQVDPVILASFLCMSRRSFYTWKKKLRG